MLLLFIVIVIIWILPSHVQNGAEVNRKNRDNLIPLDLVKDTEGDLSDLLRGEAALLDAAKKGDIDRVSDCSCYGDMYYCCYGDDR